MEPAAPSQLARLVEEVVEAGDCLAVVFREDPFTACNVPRIDRPAPSDARAEDKVSEQKKRPAEAADLPDEPPQKMPA